MRDMETGAVRPKKMSRRKLAHATQQGALARTPKVGEIVAERFEVQTSVDARNRDQRLQLRRERHAAGQVRVVERLDPESVSRDEKLLLFAIPNGEGEDAVELIEHGGAMEIVKRTQNRRVGMRVERVSTTAKVFAQILEVVYFAVEYDLIAPATTRHWLRRGARWIDNGQAPMRKPDPGALVHPYSFAVGASMGDRSRHPAQEFRGEVSKVARDAAHALRLGSARAA
jgi:hypothetical protein